MEMETLHRFSTPLVEKDGKYFWDIFVLEKEILEGLGKAAGKPVESIGIDTWGVDFCCVDAEGKVAMPREVAEKTGLGPVPVVAVAGHDTGSAVAAGKDMMDAFDQTDVLNKAACIYMSAKNMGFEPDGMTDASMKEIQEVFKLPKTRV